MPDASNDPGKTCRRSEIALDARQSYYTALRTQSLGLNDRREEKKQLIQAMVGNGQTMPMQK
jgi:hypothetical protein